MISQTNLATFETICIAAVLLELHLLCSALNKNKTQQIEIKIITIKYVAKNKQTKEVK